MKIKFKKKKLKKFLYLLEDIVLVLLKLFLILLGITFTIETIALLVHGFIRFSDL